MRFFILYLIFFIFFCFSLFAEETITLTTYYPSPYGVYKRLVANEGISFNGNFPGEGAISIQSDQPSSPGSVPRDMQFYVPNLGDGAFGHFDFFLDNGLVLQDKVNIASLYTTPGNALYDTRFLLRGEAPNDYLYFGTKKSAAFNIPYVTSNKSGFPGLSGMLMFYGALSSQPEKFIVIDPARQTFRSTDGIFYFKRYNVPDNQGPYVYIDSVNGEIWRVKADGTRERIAP